MAFFFLIAQCHNVPFQNTNTVVVVCGGHACNFKKAVAELCPQSAHVSAQTRSQRYQERRRAIISSCCRADAQQRVLWKRLKEVTSVTPH